MGKGSIVSDEEVLVRKVDIALSVEYLCGYSFLFGKRGIVTRVKTLLVLVFLVGALKTGVIQ